ncbi:GAS2 domain-containing protein [Arthroderma uncinatum]|uniref:GAS2 domain-containing protein n=1 Tax=Arthroderma uncinatum TaxID=74035 RepID=UPI00144AB68B|nr:GAS2 domain-containing protein [Arthroderma uncinatum]KAF3490655.1 GAS2 domain-containing protein [Arthroderma uncinatum]
MARSPFRSLDPAVRLPPRHSRAHSRSSRSTSRSPERRAQFLSHQLDPLLSDLSPETTLQVLSATDAIPINKDTPHSVLAKSISDVSTVDRAFGIRAAVAAQKLNEWHTEVLSWLWPEDRDTDRRNGFLPPGNCPESTSVGNAATSAISETEAYFGCLPASILKLYQTRIMEIKDGMEALEVEELKEHVLTVHIASRSRPPSAASTMSTNSRLASYLRLSDFTAVITATILRALPVLSKLNNLLSNWHSRLLVLGQVPGLLRGLRETKQAIDIALRRLQEGMLPELNNPLFSRESFRASWRELQSMVSSLGRRIDGMLDILEGREDSLPDTWIDEMESIEARFATWAYEAERRAVQNELRCLYQLEVNEYISRNASKEPMEDTLKDCTSGNVAGDISNTDTAQLSPSHPEVRVEDHTSCRGAASSNLQASIPQAMHVIQENEESQSQTTVPPVVHASSTVDTQEYSTSNSLPKDRDPIKMAKDTSIIMPDNSRPITLSPSTQAELCDDAEVAGNPSDVGTALSEPSHTTQLPLHDGTGSEYIAVKLRETIVTEDAESSTSNDHRDMSPDTSPAPIMQLAGLRKRPSKREKPIPSRLQLIPSGSDATIKQRDSIISINSSSGSSFVSIRDDADIKAAQIVKSPRTPAHVSPDFSSSGSVIHHTPEAAKDGASRLPSSESSSPEAQTPPSLRLFGRTMSLPLARYINDESGSIYGQDNIYHPNDQPHVSNPSVESLDVSPKGKPHDSAFDRRGSLTPGTPAKSELRRSVSSASISSSPRLKEKLSLGRLSNYMRVPHLRRSASSEPLYLEKSPISIGSPDTSFASTPLKPINLPSRLSPLPRSSSPETPSTCTEGDSPEHISPLLKQRFHPALKTPVKSSHDQLDDRIHSILDTIPTKIRLKSAVSEDSGDRPMNDNLRVPKNSGRTRPSSPTPSRSSTPTPSLTLTPAFGRSKRPRNNRGPDDVRLYHLHRGGKAAPVKLFVRLVGETGERVMVRVGGGWADLGEYLREYAMHHGRRGIIDGRFEVQGIPVVNAHPRSTTPTNGRTTPVPPSRPGSALDVRPGSSLQVRKPRRATGSGADLLPNLTAANIQRLSEEGVSPGNSSFLSSQRRPSVSSATSTSITSAIGDNSFNTTPSHRSFSTVTGAAHSTPLGLAGPKPRSKQHTISPESEAWVEDVMGQARRSSSTLRAQRSMTAIRSSSGVLRRIPSGTLNEQSPTNNIAMSKVRNENKLRSASDMGSVSLNKRVFLRRLGKEKE